MTKERHETGSGPQTLETLLLDAALGLIEREGWRDLTMGRFARAAGVPLAELYRRQRDKADILRGLINRIDLAALSEDEPGLADGDTPRDRLFDAVMLRFEAMEPYRGAIRVLAEDLRRDPLSLAQVLPEMRQSLRWTLDAAGLDPSGVTGAVRVRVLGLVCLQTLQVWLDDDGRDLAKTMADLDRRLRRSGRWLGLDRRSSASAERTQKDVEPDRKVYGEGDAASAA
ncbi:MAG: TetR family transcriptional regulator [Alphaproteobacteria bacterium]